MQIRVGCCGWAVAREKYAKELDAVEIQQTFYDPPREETLRRWRAELPTTFAFTLKCFQVVTHERSSPTYRRLRRPLPDGVEVGHFRDNPVVRAAWRETLRCARVLRAPIVLVQTPARFVPSADHLRRLEAFAQWESCSDIQIVFEPRGPAWDARLTDRVCRRLGWLRGGDPFASGPPEPANQSVAYFRLHGRGGFRYRYSDEELQQLGAWAKKYDQAWVFFNNHRMWDDALRFRTLIGGRSGSAGEGS